MSIAIIVHGGAGTITPDRFEVVQAGCREAALVGWHILQQGGSALDAAEATVRVLEDNPEFNAGTGSCLTADGHIELDAGMMEGHTLRVGAVANIERIKNPISLARHVLESPHALLVGVGAQDFALEHGISFCSEEDLLTERQYENWKLRQRDEYVAEDEEPSIHRVHVGYVARREPPKPQTPEEKHGTVGAVALDQFGTLVAATSTGGIPNKYPGRVGDSPLVGCGFYADDNAAISCTGHGEDFIRLMIARRAAEGVARGLNAREAAEAAIAFLGERASGLGGLIMVDRLGNIGFAWNTAHMAYAYIGGDMQEPLAGV